MTVRYYMDDDVTGKRVIAAVRVAGVHIRASDEFGMRGARDEEHLEFSASHGMVLVTANRGDFSRLHREWIAAGRTHSGIVIVLQPTSIGERVRGLLAIDELFEEHDIRGELLYLSDWV